MYFSFLNIFFLLLLQIKYNLSSSCNRIIFKFFNVKGSWAITWPFTSSLTLLFWNNFHQVWYNKWWVKSDTKLTDNIVFKLAVSLEILNKLFWATFCNSSQMIYQTLTTHSNSVVFNYQLVFGWEKLNIYDKIGTRLILESLFLKSIWSIGKQLSDKYFTVSIQRLSNNIQKPFSLSLEL